MMSPVKSSRFAVPGYIRTIGSGGYSFVREWSGGSEDWGSCPYASLWFERGRKEGGLSAEQVHVGI